MRIVAWMPPLFSDRAAAGRALADTVARSGVEEPIVVGVARGGVAVAAEVARPLGAPLTAVDVERITLRGARLGSVTAEGPPFLVRSQHGAEEAAVEQAVDRARRKAESLEARLEHAPPSLAGRTTLVVDDGVVTGLTLGAACRWARTQAAARVVAATPVGRSDGLSLLAGEADLVLCPHPLEEISVVGQAYDSFDPLDEWYVSALLAGDT